MNVRVFGQDNMSARSRVRADGNISLPFLTTSPPPASRRWCCRRSCRRGSRSFRSINNPVVTISLEEIRPVPCRCSARCAARHLQPRSDQRGGAAGDRLGRCRFTNFLVAICSCFATPHHAGKRSASASTTTAAAHARGRGRGLSSTPRRRADRGVAHAPAPGGGPRGPFRGRARRTLVANQFVARSARRRAG